MSSKHPGAPASLSRRRLTSGASRHSRSASEVPKKTSGSLSGSWLSLGRRRCVEATGLMSSTQPSSLYIPATAAALALHPDAGETEDEEGVTAVLQAEAGEAMAANVNMAISALPVGSARKQSLSSLLACQRQCALSQKCSYARWQRDPCVCNSSRSDNKNTNNSNNNHNSNNNNPISSMRMLSESPLCLPASDLTISSAQENPGGFKEQPRV